MRRNIMVIMVALLFTGCTSYQQMNGVLVGSSLGGLFGSSIGGVMDGPRGHDAGGALGMIIGGVAGAVATAPRERTNRVTEYEDCRSTRDIDSYNRRKSTRKNSSHENVPLSIPVGYDNLLVENLRFFDENHNQSIDGGERCKIVFEIKNNGDRTLFNVAPVLTVSDTKRILISPTAIVASIAPGKSVRYSADVYGKENLRSGVADFSLGFSNGKVVYTVRTFQLNTVSR